MGLWDRAIGQAEAVELLTKAVVAPVHAYLFLGPAGSGKKDLARAFAAGLLCATGGCGTCRSCTLALAGAHPDVAEIERVGAGITIEQARDIVRAASLTPVESDRKVLILDEFHLVTPEAAAALLKTIEEPPASTVFCVLADTLVPHLVTIASRCVRVGVHALTDDQVERTLRAEGVDAAMAAEAARAAAGNLSRARLLATDTGLFSRRAAFAGVVQRVDGTGVRAATLADELLALIDAAAEPLKARHTAELADLEARVTHTGERGAGRRSLEERQRRELRRHRTDELRSGLGTMAAAYRDRLVQGVEGRRALEEIAAVDRITDAIDALSLNPNEALLLQALLVALPPV